MFLSSPLSQCSRVHAHPPCRMGGGGRERREGEVGGSVEGGESKATWCQPLPGAHREANRQPPAEALRDQWMGRGQPSLVAQVGDLAPAEFEIEDHNVSPCLPPSEAAAGWESHTCTCFLGDPAMHPAGKVHLPPASHSPLPQRWRSSLAKGTELVGLCAFERLSFHDRESSWATQYSIPHLFLV